MNSKKFFREYLSSRKVWAVAGIYFLVGELTVFLASRVFDPGFALHLASLLSVVLMTGSVYYLKGDIREKREELSIGFTFGVLGLLVALFTIVGSAVFTPRLVTMSLPNLLNPIGLFLTATGIYYLIDGAESKQIEELTFSTALATGLTFIVYTAFTEGPANTTVLLSFLTEPSTLDGLINLFLGLSALTLGMENYLDLSNQKLAGIGLTGYGFVSLVVNYGSDAVTYSMNSQLPQEAIMSIPWASVFLIAGGISYYGYMKIDEYR